MARSIAKYKDQRSKITSGDLQGDSQFVNKVRPPLIFL